MKSIKQKQDEIYIHYLRIEREKFVVTFELKSVSVHLKTAQI